MGYIAGKSGQVAIGNSTYAFDTWNLGINCQLPEVTNFTSGGFQEVVANIFSGDLSVSGPYNSGSMAFTAGSQYTWLLGFTNSITLTCPAMIDKIGAAQMVKDKATINITAKTNGSFSVAIV